MIKACLEHKIRWDDSQNNKLKEIVPDLTKQQQIQCETRRDEVVLTRLRIGHSRLTHSFLMKREPFACLYLLRRSLHNKAHTPLLRGFCRCTQTLLHRNRHV